MKLPAAVSTLIGVCVVSLMSACESRQPVGLEAPREPARRTDTYGAPTLLANFEYQALCNTLEFLRDAWCIDQRAKVIAELPPVRHRVTVRISGVIQLHGIGGPARHCPNPVYPLGFVTPDGRPPFLRTGVYWEAPRARSVHVPLAPVNGDSATVEGSVDVPEGGALYIYRLFGGQLTYCHMVSPPPVVTITIQEIIEKPPASIHLNCSPSTTVTRGDSISCDVSVNPAELKDSFKVTGWSFNGQRRTDGDTASLTWAGPMVDSGGVVRVQGIVQGQSLQDSARIRILPRQWPELEITRVNHRIEVDPATMQPYPPDGLAFGRHQRGHLAFDSMQIRFAASGPNAGYFYITAPVRILPSTIWVHPALYFNSLPAGLGPSSPGYSDWADFYNDQNGVGSGDCHAAGVARFRRNVERHEGVTLASNSHVGVANRSFRSDSVQKRFERIYSLSDSGDVKYRVGALFDSLTNATSAYRQRQAHFDSTDTPNVYNVGCILDMNRSDP